MASLAYFTVPKLLDTDPRYTSLSVEARYLYAHMRDTMKLSLMNNWRDRLGVYIKMSRERMAALLGKSLPTVRKVLSELKKAGLIIDIRMGLTRCNRIYVQLLPGEQESDLQPARKETPPSVEKPGFTPDRNAFSGNNRNFSHPNPIEPNKKGWKWFITEGTKWFDADGRIWQFIDGEIAPYLVGEDHVRATGDLLAQIGMA